MTKKPVDRVVALQDAIKVVNLLRETLELNEVWLSTSLSATGSLLMHLLIEAGMKEESLENLKNALYECAVSLGATSIIVKGNEKVE